MKIMKSLICECGHTNLNSASICEKCDRPLNSKEGLLDMRYEGVARRSLTYRKNLIDKIWLFFSSVKVGVWIIVITLSASAIGTILPQEMYIPPSANPASHYKEQYGVAGQIYYFLGFHNLYQSWWYMLLLALMGLSLVIASIDRVVPLYKALKKQRVYRHRAFLERQRIYGVTKYALSNEGFELLKERLAGKGYRVGDEKDSIFAEKGRFSRWGPYINHLGLIIVLIGAMLRFFPGMYVDETLWIRDGETKVIPGTKGDFYLSNDKFVIETYGSEDERYQAAIDKIEGVIVKNYQTNAVLLENTSEAIVGAEPTLKEIKKWKIKVNEPLKFNGYAIYQVSYKLNEFHKMSFTLEEKSTGTSFGEIKVDLFDPETDYDLGNGYRVELLEYFPDFEFDEKGPTTKSKIPNNPAFVFNMYTPETKEGETSFVAIKENLEPLGVNQYKMTFSGLDVRNITALTVRKDLTLGIIALGGLIFMIGVVQGMYWNHRRIWFQINEDEVLLAGHTNKNWYGLKKDIELVVKDSGVSIPIDQKEGEDIQND
jgi:cytochrome c biogenesis protein